MLRLSTKHANFWLGVQSPLKVKEFSVVQKLYICYLCRVYFCLVPSCEPECLNGATCESGICNCPEGFAGIACEFECKYLASYIIV